MMRLNISIKSLMLTVVVALLVGCGGNSRCRIEPGEVVPVSVSCFIC